jgi:hypothetical protein
MGPNMKRGRKPKARAFSSTERSRARRARLRAAGILAPVRHAIAPDDEMERRGYDQALTDLVMRLKQIIADLPAMLGEPNRAVVLHRVGLERAISTAEELRREKCAEIGQT